MMVWLRRLTLIAIWRQEFAGYNWAKLRRDLLAGVTVGAVALPLALAFGVASGADAAAGLVTAILAGIIIGGLGGASFQISGPTGAMSAILLVIAAQYGLGGVWAACVLAGFFLVLLGLFKLGRYVSFIPSPVISGFTSGIALIIAVGQLDNVLGVQTPAAENALAKLWHYLSNPPTPNWQSLALAAVVMATMIGLPRFTKAVPASLVGLVLATLLAVIAGWSIPVIGVIPATILLDNRLSLSTIPWESLTNLIGPAISIAALGAIESLLCGSVGAAMTGKQLDNNQELIGQGIGNMIIPFFGGVPATAAIARSSVAIKSGAETRLTSIIHALVLLLSALVLAPLLGRVPLAALGGVLLITAWKMNEWHTIQFFTKTRLKHALAGFFVTMIATAALDLTQAILIGIAISAVIYLRQSALSTEVTNEAVSLEKLQAQGYQISATCPGIHVYYLTGPIFFGSVHTVLEALKSAARFHTLVISMRGVPLVDAMGVQAIDQLIAEQRRRDGIICFSGLQPAVREMFARTGLLATIGEPNIYWSAVDAIMSLHDERKITGCAHCASQGSVCEVFAAAEQRQQRNPPPIAAD